eukprot:1082008_1
MSAFMRPIQHLLHQHVTDHYFAVFIPSSVAQQTVALCFIHQQITHINGLINGKKTETILLLLQSIANELELQQERMNIPSNGFIIFAASVPPREIVCVSITSLTSIQSFDYLSSPTHHNLIKHRLLHTPKIDIPCNSFAVCVLNWPYHIGIHDLYIRSIYRDSTKLLFHQRKQISLPRKHSRGGSSQVRFQRLRL